MPILENTLFTVGGFLLALAWELAREKYQFRRELKENDNINLSGDWIAAWQTSVDGEVVLNTEELKIAQKGSVVRMQNKAASPENKKAGYRWQGRLQFYQGRDLMGHYCANRVENNTAKGIMYFHFNSARKEFVGRWVGCSYDGPLLCGFGTITKEKERSLQLLQELIKMHPDKVPIISYAMV